MKRKIIPLLVAATMAMIGLTALASPAQAIPPLTGNHTASFRCTGVNNAVNQTTKLEWSMTANGVDSFGRNKFNFQMNKATFTGGQDAYSGVKALITSPFSDNAPVFVSTAGGGAAGTAPQIFPGGTALGSSSMTPVVRENGVGGVSWPTIGLIDKTTANSRTFWLYVQIRNNPGTNSCDEYFDLSMPDRPIEGSQSGTIACDVNGDGLLEETLDLDYEVSNVGGDQYSFHIEAASYEAEPGTLTGPENGIHLYLTNTGLGGSAVVDSGSANWDGSSSTPYQFNEADGVGGVSFPTVNFTHTAGEGASVVHADFLHLDMTTDPPTDNTCSTSMYLTKQWDSTNIGSDPSFEDILFDDCLSGAGELSVKPIWERTADDKFYRLKALSIFQDSNGLKIVLDPGTSTTAGGLTVTENAFPSQQLVTLNSTATLAERTITDGETQVIPLSTPEKWTRMNGTGLRNPSGIYSAKTERPMVQMKGRLYLSTGAECVPDSMPSHGSIAELEWTPITID